MPLSRSEFERFLQTLADKEFLPSAVQAFSSSLLRSEDDPVSVEARQHSPALAPLPAEPAAGHVVLLVGQPGQQPAQLHGQWRRGL